MKKYKEFLITAEPFIPDVICGILWDLNISGINEEEKYLRVYAGEDSDTSFEEIKKQLEKLVTQRLLINFNIEQNIIEDKNWNEEWEKSLKIIEISDNLVIKPTFREYVPKPGQAVIIIDPKMSFGTGEHQTTKLVLQFLEKYVQQEDRVLDIGSGTGVLSITSVVLGAAFAVAVDNNEWCSLNGKENCELNSVTRKVDVRLGEIKDVVEKDFDLVLANIKKNILLEIAEDIKTRIKNGGFIILSGLLISDEDDIKRLYSGFGFRFVEMKKMDEWISMIFQKV